MFDLSSHGSRWDTMTHPPSSPSKFTGASNTTAPTHKCSLLHAPTWIPASVLSGVGGGGKMMDDWKVMRSKGRVHQTVCLLKVVMRQEGRWEQLASHWSAQETAYILYLLMETDDNRMTPTPFRFLTHISEGTHLDWVTHDNGGQ